ncbi:MAG TPA: VOC family protein [Actinomycetes bacterium]|nr:VOC family protein [Actinomycetes bacterium]
MSFVTENQPDGTPTWIDLGIPDLEGAMAFYGAVFGWEFEVGPPETMRYTQCLLGGRRVAALAENPDPAATAFWWNMYLATGDCQATARRVSEAGGSVVMEPMEVMDQGVMAIVKDPVGAQFGLWQGGAHIGCEVVNEPGSLLRNDLVTPDPGPARAFYTAVFDFTFLRRPDGHEVGGIMGIPGAPSSAWSTTFEVADTDAVLERATAAGGTAGTPEDFVYGRMATVTDPFGTELSVIARP